MNNFCVHYEKMLFVKGDVHIWGVFLPRVQWTLINAVNMHNRAPKDLENVQDILRFTIILIVYLGQCKCPS